MAELSPELASRIQQLEASYASNASRFFVAYAGALRDAGDIARAEEILRTNLRQYPAGLSPHVLLGRCLADRGAYQEAANEFHYVLSIDPQNLIALRTLAEMAQATGRPDEARRWYNELLSVDPMNADARAALSLLDQSGADAATVDQPMQVGTDWGGAREGEPAAGAASDAGYGDDGFGIVDLAAPSSSAADEPHAPTGLEGWGDIAFDDAPPADEPAAAPTLPTADDGFDAFGFGSLDLDARHDIAEPAAMDAGSLDDTLLDVSGAGLPLLDLGDDPAAHDHHDDVDAEVVTETMAELYASQGLHDRAADVYRTLIEQRGPEPSLVRRLSEIEAQTGGAHPAGPSAFGAGDDEEAAPDWLASVDAFASGGAPSALPDVDFAALSADVAPSAIPASADPFADSFADGFGGGDEAALPEPAMASADPYDDRAAWEPPTVTPAEGAGFDLIVVDEDGGEMHIPASAEEVADLSADWAVAAAPLHDHEDEEEEEPAAAAYAPAGPTMSDYFQSLLSWQPGQSAAAAPAYEASAAASTTAGDDLAFAADDGDYGDDLQPMLPDALAEPGFPAIEPPVDEPAPLESYLAGTDTAVEDEPAAPIDEPAAMDGLDFSNLGVDAVADAPARTRDEDEPWAFPTEDAAPAPVVEPAAERAAIEPEPLDLDEPWAAPAPARTEPVDLGVFELSDELTGTTPAGSAPAQQEPAQVDDEGLLPWEMPAEPAQPAAAEPSPGGFSFEDFFSGGTTPAAPEPAPAPAPAPFVAPAPEPAPYTPSAFAAPTPPPAAPPAAPAAGAQDEDDEDLESFQAWLQSLKR